MIEVDSLVGNEFEIWLNDDMVQGVFRLEGMTTFQLDPATGERIHTPLQLTKMVQRDGQNPFNTWLRETMADGADKPRRAFIVKAIDDGVETRCWTFKEAYIAAVSYRTFDTGSAEMVEEVVTIEYESVEEDWPATP